MEKIRGQIFIISILCGDLDGDPPFYPSDSISHATSMGDPMLVRVRFFEMAKSAVLVPVRVQPKCLRRRFARPRRFCSQAWKHKVRIELLSSFRLTIKCIVAILLQKLLEDVPDIICLLSVSQRFESNVMSILCPDFPNIQLPREGVRVDESQILIHLQPARVER